MQGHMWPDGTVFEKKLKLPSNMMAWSHFYFFANPIDLTANSIYIFFRVLANFAFTFPMWIHIVLPENSQWSEQGKNSTSVLTEMFFILILLLLGTNSRIPVLNEMQRYHRSRAVCPQCSLTLRWVLLSSSGVNTQCSRAWHGPRQTQAELPWIGEISLHSDNSKKNLTRYVSRFFPVVWKQTTLDI